MKAHKFEADDWKGFNPHQPLKPCKTLYFFDAMMLKFIEERCLSPADKNCMKHLYRQFSGYCLNDVSNDEQGDDEKYSLLDVEAIAEYKSVRAATMFRGKTIASGTIRRELATLSSAINHARLEWNWLILNPVEGRRPKAGKPCIVWATPEEAYRMISTARQNSYVPYLVDFVELGLNTGMRKMEMLACELKRIDLRQGVIHIDPNDKKNGQYGTVPLNKTARKVILRRLSYIKAHCPNTPWLFPLEGKGETGDKHLGDIRTSFKRMCHEAGMPHFFPHALRHTYCSWLLQAGVPIYTAKDCMRHASITQTEEYGHLAPKNRKDSVGKLDKVLSRICHADVSTQQQATKELDLLRFSEVNYRLA